MTRNQAIYIIQKLKNQGVSFENGLSNDEVLEIESKFQFRFPDDLKLFLQTNLPISEGFVNWRLGLILKEEQEKIILRLNWPLEGMLFDIKSNNFWVDEWGLKPSTLDEKFIIAKSHYGFYPKLIPIYSHRYISSQPSDSGNPVFSVYQMDIIYYEFDLATYFSKEFEFNLTDDFEKLDKSKVEIEFWSEWT